MPLPNLIAIVVLVLVIAAVFAPRALRFSPLHADDSGSRL